MVHTWGTPLTAKLRLRTLHGVCICYSTFWSGVAGLSARHPRARSARGGRADKPQHHDKRWNKMLITVDWSLLGNLRAREGGAVKFFQIRQALASARVKLGERRCLETL